MAKAATPVRMAHVALTVTFGDLDRLSDFYQQVFGWRIEREIVVEGIRNQFLTDDYGNRIELVGRTVVDRLPPPPEPPGHICFAIPDDEFDSIVERARAAGADVPEANESTPRLRNETDPVTGEPKTTGPITHYVFFYDPCGNCIELSSGAYRTLPEITVSAY